MDPVAKRGSSQVVRVPGLVPALGLLGLVHSPDAEKHAHQVLVRGVRFAGPRVCPAVQLDGRVVVHPDVLVGQVVEGRLVVGVGSENGTVRLDGGFPVAGDLVVVERLG